ncbi:MAG TPA: hypothetical protein VKV95_05765 [Terriglobia bacterium]|nr:hypothetical protein [Terriglobia bacterium]
MKSRQTFAILVVFAMGLSAGHIRSALAASWALGGQWASAFGTPAQAPISVTIRAVQPVVRAGSPVIIELVAKNVSDHGIPEYRGFGNLRTPGLNVEVRDRTGALPPRTEFAQQFSRRADATPPRTIVGGPEFKPGEVWEDTLYIDGEHDMSKAGDYTIQIGQRVTSNLVVESNIITVTIKEPSEYDRRFAGATAPFLLTITIPEDTVKSGSDIPLRMYTTNLTGLELAFDCARYDEQAYDAGGNPLPWIGGPGLRKVIETGNGHPCGVGPHGTEARLAAHLDMLYDLSRPGTYTIQASRFDDQTKTWVKSNTITMRVVP